jgi:pimeloyl-ACP methyl ester carboxylesterase
LLTLLAGGVGAVIVAGAIGIELVDHGVLPGKQTLDQVDGACDVPAPTLSFLPTGPSHSGTFDSQARHRTVGYTISYPPGHGPGDELPLIVMLHGFGGNHTTAVPGMSPVEALALRNGGVPLRPMAMVTVDGGDGYWNPHPKDDPLAMVVDELIPFCQQRGLGTAKGDIATMGVSMGGYGALEIAERNPRLVAAVAAISPAVWTSFAQSQGANSGAFDSAASFAAGNVIEHAPALAGIPVRVASGVDDPFHPGVVALAAALPSGSTVSITGGCHSEPFFLAQVPPSMAFLSAHLG